MSYFKLPIPLHTTIVTMNAVVMLGDVAVILQPKSDGRRLDVLMSTEDRKVPAFQQYCWSVVLTLDYLSLDFQSWGLKISVT